jgi:prolyl-tRNA synthetase
MLNDFQRRLFQRALGIRESFTVQVDGREALLRAFDGRQALAIGPWCGRQECELEIKDAAGGVTIRNLAEAAPPAGAACAACGRPASSMARWARAY